MLNSKYNKRRLLFALIILSIGINVYFRLGTLLLPHIDKITKKEIYNNIKNDLYKSISSVYPEVPDSTKRNLQENLFKEYLKENEQEVKKSIIQKSKETKEYFQDERGWTYLLENDSYRWLRRIESYLNTGHFGTSRLNNQEYDDLEFAPQGDKVEPLKLHFYLGVYFYKFLHFINNKLSLMNCVSLSPVLLSPLLVISVFCICILFGLSYLGSFLASLVVCLSPLVLIRSSFGWFDTDIYNVFIPIITTSILAYSFKEGNSKNKIFALLSAGFLLGIYSALWSAWWLLLYLLLAGMVLHKLSIIIYDRQHRLSVKIKESLSDVLLFTFFAYLSVLFISGLEVVKRSFWEPFSYFVLRQSLAVDNFWPNIAFSISELRRTNIEDMVVFVGGRLILYGGLIGALLLFSRIRPLLDFREKNFILFVLFIWLLAAFTLMPFAKRFILFLITPLGIFLCALLDILYNYMYEKQNLLGFIKKVNKKVYNSFLGCIFFSVTIIPLYNAYKLDLRPLMNDSWWNMFMYIRKTTPPEAIIHAYWSEGDWIMSIAKRATVNDPHWQFNAMPYWVSRALLTDNEEEAAGIIRMINSGGNRAFDELSQTLNYNKYASLELINRMVVLKKDDGAILLNKYIQDKNTLDKILKLIYGPARPAYLLVYYPMISFMPRLSKIANWDFKRFDLWQKFTEFKKDNFINYAKGRLGYSEEDSKNVYRSILFTDNSDISDWISTGIYQFYTVYSEKILTNKNEKIILFDNGLSVDRENLKAYFRDDISAKWITPGHLIFITKEEIKENINSQGDSNYSVMLSEDNNVYKALLFSRPLAQSLFFKLFFMNGRGLKHFKLINHESKKGYNNIYLYKIDWDSTTKE